MDDDSADLHPVGYCLKTQHPLEPPLTLEEIRLPGPCGVGGCRGLGSLRGGPHKQHVAASACPYRAPAPPPPDRLAPHAHSERMLPRPRRVPAKPKPLGASTPNSDTSNTNNSKSKYVAQRGRPPKHKRVEEVLKNELSDDDSLSSGGGGGSKRWRGSTRDSNEREEPPPPIRTYSRLQQPAGKSPPRLPPAPTLDTDVHISELALPTDPLRWSQEEVSALVTRIAGPAAGAAALGARLSGAELLLASREELVHCARMRLGPAVKVYAALTHLRANSTASA
ncbi:hypothetical protein O0L34_g6741 [Tuta absoluta]|nr:hypothetical protein O0L34_g6741 [Tuta absoluta]